MKRGWLAIFVVLIMVGVVGGSAVKEQRIGNISNNKVYANTIKLDIPKSNKIYGDWVLIKEWTNPWARAWVSGYNYYPNSYISKETGVGEARVSSSSIEEGLVYLGVSPLMEDEALQWLGDTTQGRIIIKEPSIIAGGAIHSSVGVIICVKEYDQNWNLVKEWHDTVLLIANDASFYESLDWCTLNFTLTKNHLYVPSVAAKAAAPPFPQGIAEIKPVKFIKLWLLAYLEEPVEITLECPKEGWVYFQGIPLGRLPGCTWALWFNCPFINCIAHVEGDVDFVKFECAGKTCTDSSPDANGNYNCKLYGVGIGGFTLHAYAYKNNQVVAQDSVPILKFPI